jgi:hypothetical protein
MPSRHPPARDSADDAFHSWLDRSIQHPVYIDRSDGEKAAEERFIFEKAKTERWNRWISRVWYSLKLGIPVAILAFLAGFWAAIALL